MEAINLSLASESEAIGTTLVKDTYQAGRGKYKIRYRIVAFGMPPATSRNGGGRGVFLERRDGNSTKEPQGKRIFKSKDDVQKMILDKGFGVLPPKTRTAKQAKPVAKKKARR